MKQRKAILLADAESFYASVEAAQNPSGASPWLFGDPALRHGIVLAASRAPRHTGQGGPAGLGVPPPLPRDHLYPSPHGEH